MNIYYYKQIGDLLTKQWVEHSKMEPSDYQELKENFPFCLVKLEAYRAIVCREEEICLEKLHSPYHSWSLSMKGIREFLNNEQVDGFFKEPAIVFKAEVEGIDISALVRFLVKEQGMTPGEATKFYQEEEIVALSVSNAQKLLVIDP